MIGVRRSTDEGSSVYLSSSLNGLKFRPILTLDPPGYCDSAFASTVLTSLLAKKQTQQTIEYIINPNNAVKGESHIILVIGS